ncbi:hypothetical protein E2C01_007940 [Portunus trituberculatus]|uniref:Uncharacterized protein n=1 Tax=Portunus trituberculatus TaxID=210409 RepID=A0A5B7D3N8_PORTR|nr:hypothetical protein [Portunus trituberculatus]
MTTKLVICIHLCHAEARFSLLLCQAPEIRMPFLTVKPNAHQPQRVPSLQVSDSESAHYLRASRCLLFRPDLQTA